MYYLNLFGILPFSVERETPQFQFTEFICYLNVIKYYFLQYRKSNSKNSVNAQSQ
uniref:Uncharacterized protein n=1 Tax=Meloidogyne enterolobii TaxID=390850 RepID=A0A6V7X0Z0_MELEN|nr:unnamed protein product [Meloidogyne enterolobii]